MAAVDIRAAHALALHLDEMASAGEQGQPVRDAAVLRAAAKTIRDLGETAVVTSSDFRRLEFLLLHGPTSSNYKLRMARLLYELHRDEVLSEQQCAKWFMTDLVSWRIVRDSHEAGDTAPGRRAAGEPA